MDDITEALQLIADVDNDHLHAFHDPLNPRHSQAVRCYSELLDYVCAELNRRGSRDYQIGKSAPHPPPLKETRPGFVHINSTTNRNK